MLKSFIASFLLLSAIGSVHADTIQYDFPLSVAATTLLQPGASTELSVQMGNTTSQVSPDLSLGLSSWDRNDFTVRLDPQPGCGQLMTEVLPDGFASGRISVPPIAAGQTRTCVLHITRSPTARTNLRWFLSLLRSTPSESPWAYAIVSVGSFIDAELVADVSAHSVDAGGIAQTVYRLGVRNPGPISLAAPLYVSVGDICTPEPVQIDANVEGGCILESSPCAFTGSPGKVARLPAAAPGQTSSCLVRLTHPHAANASVNAVLAGNYIDASSQNKVEDSNDTNNSKQLPVNVAGGGGAPTGLPLLSDWSLLLLAVSLCLAATVARMRNT